MGGIVPGFFVHLRGAKVRAVQIAVLLALATALPEQAAADHWISDHHQPDRAVNFYIHSNSIGTVQGDAIAAAAKAW